MSKLFYYLTAAVCAAGIAWFGYHWQHGTDPLAVVSSLTGKAGSQPPGSGRGTTSGAIAGGKPGANSGGKPASAKPGGKSGGRKGRGPVGVRVAQVEIGTVEERVNAVGSLLAAQSVLIKPEIEGRIAEMNVTDGASISAGDILFRLDATVVNAEFAQAKAELSLALNNLKRTRNLAAQNFVSRRSRDEAQSNVSVRRARMQVVKARQTRTIIKAPFNGTVGLVPVNAGDYVKAGSELVRLDDMSSLKLDIRVPERLMARVKPGQDIRVRFDAYPDKAFTATVQTIDSQIDKAGRSLVVRGRLDNAEGLLRPGMFARAALVMNRRDNALMVPEASLVPGDTGNFVFKVVDGKASRVIVETGTRQDGRVEVVKGLIAGDTIVSAGQLKLRGAEVAVRVLGPGGTSGRGKPMTNSRGGSDGKPASSDKPVKTMKPTAG